jgi:hypothetical protein
MAPLQVMWELNHWRCEYQPLSEDRGIFRVLDGDVRVIEAACSPSEAVKDFSQRCMAFVQEAESHRRRVPG